MTSLWGFLAVGFGNRHFGMLLLYSSRPETTLTRIASFDVAPLVRARRAMVTRSVSEGTGCDRVRPSLTLRASVKCVKLDREPYMRTQTRLHHPEWHAATPTTDRDYDALPPLMQRVDNSTLLKLQTTESENGDWLRRTLSFAAVFRLPTVPVRFFGLLACSLRHHERASPCRMKILRSWLIRSYFRRSIIRTDLVGSPLLLPTLKGSC